MGRFEKFVVQANRALLGAMLAAVFAIMFANVVLRYGFGTSLAWSEEVSRFLMVAGAYFGAGLALREGRLVAIEFLQDLLPNRFRIALRYLTSLAMIVFMTLVAWYGLQFAQFGWNKETMATQISRGIPYAAIPVGAALFVLHALFFMRRYAHRAFEYDGAELSIDAEFDGDHGRDAR